MSTSTTTTAQLFQQLGDFYSRRLLLNTPAAPPPNSHDVASETYTGNNTFDANVIMVLSVLLCALICSLGLNSIIRCVLRCSILVASQSSDTATIARLANTGVKRKALKTFPTINYSPDLNLPGLDTECVICLAEFTVGERVRLLPKCNHGFHVKCIDKWLGSHSSCPTCRHSLIETCQKIVGCSPAEPAVQEIIVNIAPLEPEGLVRNYRS
ncbi:RING-H2 finger protein ATL78-like [Mercurialis annua]|uniref:RING-H2 finger protein ATL78-like n=1 Tax=Mercurialis annua TaxID=3986 RepID=UPI00215DDC13|nr:RING-H2 finger protein ATL78-like [Mercurialis annua]